MFTEAEMRRAVKAAERAAGRLGRPLAGVRFEAGEGETKRAVEIRFVAHGDTPDGNDGSWAQVTL